MSVPGVKGKLAQKTWAHRCFIILQKEKTVDTHHALLKKDTGNKKGCRDVSKSCFYLAPNGKKKVKIILAQLNDSVMRNGPQMTHPKSLKRSYSRKMLLEIKN